MSVNYWWFEGESVRTIAKQLLRIGSDNARLKVIPDGDKVLLQVVPKGTTGEAGTAGFEPVNESHPCPPFC